MPFRFASEIEERLAALEFETRSRLNAFERRVQELESRAQGARRQPAASSEDDPEIPRLMGTWVQKDQLSGLDDLARSLAERGPIAPAPREEEIAPPKKRVRNRAHHAAYMRRWRARQYLRKHGIPA